MSDNMLNLLSRFSEISNLKWISGISKGTGDVGITFESLLGKKADSDIFPDYKDIEIKCTQRFSRYPIGLFCKAFDGPNLYETNKILEKYGKNYQYIFGKKYLDINLIINKKVLVNEKYYFELIVEDIEERIYINIYNQDGNLLDSPYIEFKTLKNHLVTKLSNLALIHASKSEIDGVKNYRYYSINFFKLKGFDYFISLIKNGTIKLNLACRISLSKYYGKQKNKGIIFKIPKNKVDLLYKKILCYDSDRKLIKYFSK